MFYSTCKVSKSFILSYIVTYEEVINIRSFKQKILVGTQTIDAEVCVGKVRHFPAPRCTHPSLIRKGSYTSSSVP